MFFTELLGDNLGNFVNVLAAAHIVAFVAWIGLSIREARRAPKNKKFH